MLFAHSLGGIASFEMLVEHASLPEGERPWNIKDLALLITVGSQSSFLYELDALKILRREATAPAAAVAEEEGEAPDQPAPAAAGEAPDQPAPAVAGEAAASDGSSSSPLSPDFPAWLNLYDPSDLLSFLAPPVFPGRVSDEEINSRQPFPESHGAYWDNPKTWEMIKKYAEPLISQ